VLQVLFSEAGYKYIDVRPAFEFDDAGHCKQAINVPVMNLERKWSPEEQKKARSVVQMRVQGRFAVSASIHHSNMCYLPSLAAFVTQPLAASHLYRFWPYAMSPRCTRRTLQQEFANQDAVLTRCDSVVARRRPCVS